MYQLALLASLVAATMPLTAHAARCPDPAAWPPSFRLQFDARATRSVLSLTGTSSLALSREGDNYTFVSETSAGSFYSARQASHGRMGPAGFVPSEYQERSGKRPEATTRLDWAAERVSFSASDNVAPTRPQMQDRLSFLLQLGWSLKKRAAPQIFDVTVAGARRVSTYRFEARGSERIETAAGHFETLKFEQPVTDDQDGIEVWVAPALCNLPVRLRFTGHNGLVVDNELRSARLE